MFDELADHERPLMSPIVWGAVLVNYDSVTLINRGTVVLNLFEISSRERAVACVDNSSYTSA